MRMPASRSAISRPIFDMVVATTAAPERTPRVCMSRAASNSTASPFTTRPAESLNNARSASPSKVTPRSNMGLEIALREAGIRMLRANVGDKYVLEEMMKTGATLGGEQSGHIIFRDGEATTGDGLLTALRVMEVMARSGRSLADLIADLKVFPQRIQNVRVREKVSFDRVPEVKGAIEAAQRELDGNGRVVARYSGTEA